MPERRRTPRPPTIRSESAEALRACIGSLREENESLRRELGQYSFPCGLFDALGVGALVQQDGQIRYVNPALIRRLGHDNTADLLGKLFWATVPAGDGGAIRRQVTQALAGEPSGLSPIWEARCQAGPPAMVQSVVSRIDWEGRPAVLMLLFDAAERSTVEDGLAASERRFRKLIENAHDAFTLHTADTALLYESAAGYRLMGHAPGSNLGVRSLDRIHPDDLPLARQAHEQLLQHPEEPIHGLQLRVLHADGTYRWLELAARNLLADPDVGGILINWREVTQRREAEAALREGEQRLRQALDAAGMISHVVTLPAGTVEWLGNPFEFFRVSAESVGPSPDYLLLVHPDDRGRVRGELARALDEGGEVRIELRGAAPAADGGEAWYVTRARLFPAAEGHPAHLCGVTVDVTARKRAQAERQQLEDALRRAQHLESLGVLAGGIAHDFNNLLTSILGYTELSREELQPGAVVRDYLGHVERAARRAAELCKQMLAYAGRAPLSPMSVNLNEIVRETISQMHLDQPPKVRVSTRLAPNLPQVVGDSAQLHQALVNLLRNALEALGEDGGELVVATRTVELPAKDSRGQPLLGELAEGAYVEIEVRDSGSGMDEAVLARAFEPFFTTRFPGRGLGLSATLGITRAHHGTVGLESTPGVGTTARLLLPVSPPARPSPAVPSASPRFEGQVLVAEEDASVRRLAERLLIDLGLRVTTATDGLEALQRIAAAPTGYQLALIDLTMPECDGGEVVKGLTTLAPRLPVIVMSGHSVSEVRDRFDPAQVVALLQKPFTREELFEAVQQALGQ